MRKRDISILLGLGLPGLMIHLGCGGSTYPDRDPATVEDIRVDSVKILPYGSRYLLGDSATPLAILGFYPGYRCSRILEIGIADAPTGIPPAYRPSTRVRLPGTPDCALDTIGRASRDTTVPHVFGSDASMVRLANSAGRITDSARVVRGTLAFETLSGKLGIAGTLSKGQWTYRDSSAVASRRLFGDSLPPCRFLNQADFEKTGDTVTVRFSYVTLDPSAAPDSCNGAAHADSLDPAKPRP
ncbi:MAG: hypothetical protein JWP91_2205 [Fibrobacteres bacterium]|nr:hypothetical protein [Fibrobacterota bacterium]